MKSPLLALFLSLCLMPAAFAQTELLDQVIAVVNDEPITQSELDVLFRPIYEQYKKEYKGTELMRLLTEARQKLLNQMIEDKLVFQEAKTQGIEPDESEIENQVSEFKKRFKSEVEMEDALKKEGFTIADMRERLRRQSMIRKLQDMEIRSKIVVSPVEIENYYQQNPQQFSSKEMLKVRSLTIKKSQSAREKGIMDEDARVRIQNLRRRILSGEDFGELAIEHSEDTSSKQKGLSEWIEKGSMIQAIDDVIFKLKPGEISDIVETEMGFHVFRVEEKKDGYQKSLEEVREEIQGFLFYEKSQERFKEWTTDLKRNAYVSVR